MKHVVVFSVLGITPIPWTVPNLARSKYGHRFSTRTRKSNQANVSPDLERWQKLIRTEAEAQMLGNPPCQGPVKLVVSFMERTPPGKREGQIWFPGVKQNEEGKWVKEGLHEPDLTNLVKAIEDAMEGVVYCNDVQVRFSELEMVYWSTPGISVLAQEIEESDFPGQGPITPTPDMLRPYRKPRRRKKP